MRADRPAGAKTAGIQPLLWVFQVVPLALGVGSTRDAPLFIVSGLAPPPTPYCFKFPLSTYRQ